MVSAHTSTGQNAGERSIGNGEGGNRGRRIGVSTDSMERGFRARLDGMHRVFSRVAPVPLVAISAAATATFGAKQTTPRGENLRLQANASPPYRTLMTTFPFARPVSTKAIASLVDSNGKTRSTTGRMAPASMREPICRSWSPLAFMKRNE